MTIVRLENGKHVHLNPVLHLRNLAGRLAKTIWSHFGVTKLLLTFPILAIKKMETWDTNCKNPELLWILEWGKRSALVFGSSIASFPF